MSSMRSQKKTLGVMSSFDPALPVTGYLERETIRCEVTQDCPTGFDQAFRSKQWRFSRLACVRGHRR